MTADAAPSVLRRKTRTSPAAVGPSAMDVPKAIRIALARAGDVVLDAPVSVRGVAIDGLLPERLGQDGVENPLLMRLKDGQSATGLLVICSQTLAAVIEASTLGTVFAGEAPVRKPTKTDAALIRGFADAFLGHFGALSEEIAHPPPVAGYTTVAPFEDMRAAQMTLADAAHKRFRITVDFGLGAKVGQIDLVLPTHRDPVQTEADAEADWSDALERTVLATSAEIEAVLGRIALPLEHVAALKPGDVIPLPEISVDDVSLIAPTGKRVAGARLGRAGAARAVRIRLVEPEGSPPLPGLDPLGMDAAADHGGPGPLSLPPALTDGAADLALPNAGMDLHATQPEPLSLDPAPMALAASEIDFPQAGAAAIDPNALALPGIDVD